MRKRSVEIVKSNIHNSLVQSRDAPELARHRIAKKQIMDDGSFVCLVCGENFRSTIMWERLPTRCCHILLVFLEEAEKCY